MEVGGPSYSATIRPCQAQVRALLALLLPSPDLRHPLLPLVAPAAGPQVPGPATPWPRLFGPGVFRRTEAEAGRLGAGQILTEWGIAIPDRSGQI